MGNKHGNAVNTNLHYGFTEEDLENFSEDWEKAELMDKGWMIAVCRMLKRKNACVTNVFVGGNKALNGPTLNNKADQFLRGRYEEYLNLVKIHKMKYPRINKMKDEWRLNIDLEHQSYGRNVYDEDLHRPENNRLDAEPGYDEDVSIAQEFVWSTLGRTLSAELYERIYILATATRAKSAWRDEGNDSIGVRVQIGGYYESDTIKEDENLKKNEMSCYNLMLEGTEQKKFGSDKETGLFGIMRDGEHQGYWALIFSAMASAKVKTCVRNVISNYEQCGKGDIAQICLAHQQLERLHPFIDGNTRTNRLILNKLLVESNMRPSIPEKINNVYLADKATWVKVIKTGQDHWEAWNQ